ncbi:MAG: hypothetical protein JWM54_2199, partial [Acidobacteriaceae bacterium]|nr:hypothetical protein [Acidobacteriaceae bacterium]
MRAGIWLLAGWLAFSGWLHGQQSHGAFSGMDRNVYPGDTLLGPLHKSFAYTGYWLNSPPGATTNTWSGKRGLLRERGFGFMILWNGR